MKKIIVFISVVIILLAIINLLSGCASSKYPHYKDKRYGCPAVKGTIGHY